MNWLRSVTYRPLWMGLGFLLLSLGSAVALLSWKTSEAADAAPATKLTVGTPFDATPGLAEGDQRWPAVAYGKGVYLVVWQDGEAMAGVKDTNIFAARVSAEGKPLDPKAIPICTAKGQGFRGRKGRKTRDFRENLTENRCRGGANYGNSPENMAFSDLGSPAAKGFQSYPAVAFDGSNFIVAWQDYRSGKDWDLYATRVSPEGKVLDADGFAVAAVPGNQIYPALASDGKQCLLVWSDLRPRDDGKPESYALHGTFIRDGKPVQAGGRELVPGCDPKTKAVRSYLVPQLGHDGTSFVVATQHSPADWTYAGPSLFRVAADGTATPIDGGFLGESHSLACDPGGKRALVWSCAQMEHGHSAVVYLASIFTAGVKEQTNQMALGLQPAFGPRNGLLCAAAFDGKNFVAVVEQTTNHGEREREGKHPSLNVDLVATRIDPATGKCLDSGSMDVPPRGWQDMRSSRKKAAGLTGRPPVSVAADPNVQERHPALASAGGGKSLVVYSRRGGVGKFKIHAVLLSE